MLNYTNTNIFKVLADDEYDEYDGFEDMLPYNKIVDGKWRWLSPSPVASLIRTRFSNWYDGKLTWREINAIKERMDTVAEKLEEYRDKVQNDMQELKSKIRKQRLICNSSTECAKKLDEHLKICDECDENFVAYSCQFKENGVCSHYYEIKHADKQLEKYEYFIHEYDSEYIDLKIEYERALAIKENRLEEYRQQIWDDYDDWN